MGPTGTAHHIHALSAHFPAQGVSERSTNDSLAPPVGLKLLLADMIWHPRRALRGKIVPTSIHSPYVHRSMDSVYAAV